jgi:hypothetical protein
VISRDDVGALGPLVLATPDLSKLRVPVEALPKSFPLGAVTDCVEMSVLDVAVGFGAKATFRCLTEFYGLQPSTSTMHLAVARGDPEVVKLTWDRLGLRLRASGVAFAVTAARFHRLDVMRWLLTEAPAAIQWAVMYGAVREHLAGALLVLAELGFDFAGESDELWAAFAEWDSVFALELLPEPEVEQWTRLVFRARTEGARWSLYQRSRHIPADFVELTLVTAKSGQASGMVSWLAGEFCAGARVEAVWQLPLKLAGVSEKLGTCSFKELAAWLATGVASGLEQALRVRVERGDYAEAELLLKTGAGTAEPLRAAAGAGLTGMVELLLEAKADANATARNGLSPIQCVGRGGCERW